MLVHVISHAPVVLRHAQDHALAVAPCAQARVKVVVKVHAVYHVELGVKPHALVSVTDVVRPVVRHVKRLAFRHVKVNACLHVVVHVDMTVEMPVCLHAQDATVSVKVNAVRHVNQHALKVVKKDANRRAT